MPGCCPGAAISRFVCVLVSLAVCIQGSGHAQTSKTNTLSLSLSLSHTHTHTHSHTHTHTLSLSHVFILPLQVCDCLRLCVHILFALVLTGPDGHGGGDKLTVRRRLMSGFLVSAALVYAWRYYVLRWGRGWNPQQTAVGVYESVALYDLAPMAAVDKSAVTIRKGGSDLTRDSVAKSMNMIRNLSALFTRAQGSAGSVAAAGGEASAGGAGVTTVPPSPKIHSSPAGALWGGIGALWARGGGGNDARDMDGTLARSDSLQRLLDGEAGMTLGGGGGTADIENIGGQILIRNCASPSWLRRARF